MAKTKIGCWEENLKREHRVKKNIEIRRSWVTLLRTIKRFSALYVFLALYLAYSFL